MERAQDVCLFSRNRMELTGIEEVENFTEEQVLLQSSAGMIAVDGKGLKIESFNAENGQLKMTGTVDSFYYYEKKPAGRGLFGRFTK